MSNQNIIAKEPYAIVSFFYYTTRICYLALATYVMYVLIIIYAYLIYYETGTSSNLCFIGIFNTKRISMFKYV